MLKAAVSFVVAVIAISPLVFSMMNSAQLGGTYITENSLRYFPPDLRQEVYTSTVKYTSLINDAAKLLLVIAAFFVFIMTVLEYWKFDKMYKLEQKHGGGRH